MSSASLGANSTAKSRLNSIKDLEKSNSTINAFIGGRQRAWMIGQAAAIQQNKPNIAMSNPGSLNQASEPHPGTAMTPELSTTIRTNDLSTESFGSHFDGNQYPTQRQRCENTDNYSNISSTSRPVQPTPPAISPEFSTDMSGTPLVASMELPKNVDNLLPSPSPSVEPRNHSGRTMDLDQVGQEGQVTTAQSKPELVEVIAKYGTLENLERRLQDVEKPNAAADRIAIMKGPKILSDSPRRGRGRPPGSKNRSNSDRDISALRISSKRAREFPTEPRKRLQSRPNSTSPQSVNKPFTHGAPASGKVNGSAVGSPLPLGTEMQIYLQTLTQRFHGITNMPGRQGIQVELPRLELLLDACEKSDHFYLLLHQLFCYDHQIRKSDETIPGLLDMYRPGLKVVSFLLLSNNNLTPDAVTWFSSFPMPLGSLIFRVPEFQSAHAQVLRCLERIAGNWESMRTQCTRRKYPPLVDELVCLFNVESHVFQQIIFRGVLRDIWPGEQDSCFRSTEDKFEKDYKYVMLRLQMNPGPPIESITVYQDTLVESYHQIFRSHQQHMGPMRAAVNQAGSPRVTMALPQGGQPRQAPININPKRRTLSQSGRPADTTNFSPMSSGSLAAQRPHVSDQLRTSSPSVTIPPAALLTAESQHHQVLTQLYNGLSSPQINNIVQSPTTTPSFQIMGIAADGPRPPNGQHHDRHISGSGVESAVNHPLIDNNQIPNQLTTTTLHIPRVVPSNAPGDILTCHMQRRFDVQSQSQNTSPPSLHYGPHAFVQTRPQAGIQRSLTRQGSETNLTASRSNQFIRPNDSPRQAHPNPGSSTISALHQAYVRSPVLLPLDVNETPNITMSYFITIQHVIMPPRELSDGNRHVKWDFTIAKEFVDVLARDVAGFQGAPATRKLLPGSRLCRIRCIRLNNTAGLPTQSEWAVADNVWPGNTAVILNGLALEIRKKWHHGKDLPIDVTPYIKEGQNNLASAMGFPQDSKSRYAIGIEILQVVDDQQVKAGIKMLPWEEARKRIIDQSSTSDPDVEIVESQIILDLTDPYTSKMFDVPIRGQLCRHNQCFDRDIYLQTRSVSRAPGGPCGPDEFRCPICGVDARPQSLLVDGFFAAIRHELLTKGRPDVKAIVLREDGSWEIKEQEEATGETGDGTGKKSVPPDKTSVRNAPAARQSTPRDFIELE